MKFFVLFLAVLIPLGAIAAMRGPIVILSNDDFTAENGVIGGSGTSDDPYVIAGWEILLSQDEPYGIRIENVDAYFVIRGCLIRGAANPDGAAIYVNFSANGTIEDCMVRDSLNGILITNSTGFTVRDNYLAVERLGIRVTGLERAHFDHDISPTNTVNERPVYYYFDLEGEEIKDIEAGHITIAFSRDVTLSGVKVYNGDGIYIAFSQSVTVQGADLFLNPTVAITVYNSPGTIVRDCKRIANSKLAGVKIFLSDGVRVENCGLYVNGHGISVDASNGVSTVDNVFFKNAIGIYVAGASQDIQVAKNLFYQDRIAVKLESSTRAEVTASVFSENDIAVEVRGATSDYRIAQNTMIGCGYGVDSLGSRGTIEENLIALSNIAIIFEEAYKQAYPTGNTVRRNLLYRSFEAIYLGTETRQTWIYENLFWKCERNGRDLGQNVWAPLGKGNWYSEYTGKDENGDGIGDESVYFGGGGEDPAPLMDRDAVGVILGVLATFGRRTIVLRDAEGNEAEIEAFVADDDHERFLGFQVLPPEWATDFAVLFIWEGPVKSRFHMRNVYLPLRLLLFDVKGSFVGEISMEPDPEKIYEPEKPFLFALEIPEGRWGALGLGVVRELILP
jgi:parallel beta-helix repeat protein